MKEHVHTHDHPETCSDWHHLGGAAGFSKVAEIYACPTDLFRMYRFTSRLRQMRVALATAHLDHDPTNNHPRNLKALCQRCHMIHDREEHLRRRVMTYRGRRGLGDLFTGPYQQF